MSFNELTDAQAERLAFLLEELGEAQQAIGKILRHGYESRNPLDENDRSTNRVRLEKELGDVECAITMLSTGGEVRPGFIHNFKQSKLDSVKRWMHHQDERLSSALKGVTG